MQSDFYGRPPFTDDDSSLLSGVGSWNVMLRQLVCVGVALVGFAACNKTDPEPLTSGAGTTSSPAATTSTMSPTTTLPMSSTTSVTTPASTQPPATTVPAVPGAPVVPTNEQWATIIETLSGRVRAMYSDPPKADIASACAVGSECDLFYQAQLGDMANQKVHYEDYPPLKLISIDRVVDVAATSNGVIAAGTVYEITYTIQSSDFSNAHIVDESGNVVAQLGLPKDTPSVVSSTRSVVWFPQDSELPWRFAD